MKKDDVAPNGISEAFRATVLRYFEDPTEGHARVRRLVEQYFFAKAVGRPRFFRFLSRTEHSSFLEQLELEEARTTKAS